MTGFDRPPALDQPPALDRLLAPRRIALVGSTSSETGLGARTLRHLRAAGYPGTVTVAKAADLEPDTDVAVVAVPAAAARQVVSEVAERAAYVIVYTSGFEEAGQPPLTLPPGSTARIIGPNSVGLYYRPTRTVLTFAAAFDDLAATAPADGSASDAQAGGVRAGGPDGGDAQASGTKAGGAQGSDAQASGIFLISQSGAFGARLVRSARNYGVAVDGFVGSGNETEYGACELAADLIESPRYRPRVLALYLESVRDGEALRRMLCLAAEHQVSVVMLLGGESASGAAAARSHTAAVTPGHAAVAALCARYGAVLTGSDRELTEAMVGLSVLGGHRARPGAPGRSGEHSRSGEQGRSGAPGRVAVVTGSGGAGVVAADLLARRNLVLPEPSAALRDRLAALLPSYAAVGNPFDVTAQTIGDTATLAEVCRALAASGEVDSLLVVGRVGQAPELARAAGDRVPVITCALDADPAAVAPSVRAGLAVLPGLEAACTVTWAVTAPFGDAAWGEAAFADGAFSDGSSAVSNSGEGASADRVSRDGTSAVSDSGDGAAGDGAFADRVYGGTASAQPGIQADGLPMTAFPRPHGRQDARSPGLADFPDAAGSLELVSLAGLEVAPWQLAHGVADAVRAGQELGWPVVFKANLPADAHKAQRGGIRLDVWPGNAEEAAKELLELAPSLVVARQLRAGPELFVGVRRDPVCGLMIAAGLGGGDVELAGRIVSAPADATRRWLRDRLATEIFQRGGPRYAALPALLAAAAAALASFAAHYDLPLVECNPLVPAGDRLIALDARVITHD
ncbi:MAG: acetate--CoA ligase family protein [Trebonia sp.]